MSQLLHFTRKECCDQQARRELVVFARQKVKRLQDTLMNPPHLATLSPNEMERLAKAMELTDDERQQLRASLLATTVQMTVYDRLKNLQDLNDFGDLPGQEQQERMNERRRQVVEIARRAAEEVYAILYAAMKNDPSMFIDIKNDYMIDEVNDTKFDEALDLIDRAMLALHTCRSTSSVATSSSYAREALDLSTQAANLLLQSPMSVHDADTWQYWYNEARDGITMARSLL